MGGESLTESFLDALLVVVLSAAGFTSLQESLHHDFFGSSVE